MRIKYICIVLMLFAYQIHYGQYTDVINSNRPGQSMSAYSVGKTVFQVESGLNYIHQKHELLDYKANGQIFDLTLRYGFFREELEGVIDLSYQKDNYITELDSKKRSGLKNSTFGLKYLIYDPFKYQNEKKVNIYSWKANHKFNWNQFIPSVSAYAGLNLNFSDNKFLYYTGTDVARISPKIMLITQHIFGEGYVFVTNIFFDRVDTPVHSMGYVATLTKGFNEHWSAFIENKAIKGTYYSDGLFTGGAAYLFSKNLQIDASITGNVKNTPSIMYGGIGISWRSDSNYKEVKIKSKKEDKKKDKSSKGNDKDKKKKRLDEVDVKP
ncbi:transporter [Flavobacterium sp. SUN046]|uniref:transporter n=1 Tax=Flavobacterium sp. SUN046 TaxID=3002440 RepID=UPI002DBF4528|nr:transporter [Flavobacterium sp. SUN046]MEC4048345.1 transporter [Flavobacterium sp. SUN046]